MPRVTSKKTVRSEVHEDIQNVQKTFSKEQILASAKYRNRRDLVYALLEENKNYTIDEVDNAINKFLKG